jgi:hypothetical protein
MKFKIYYKYYLILLGVISYLLIYEHYNLASIAFVFLPFLFISNFIIETSKQVVSQNKETTILLNQFDSKFKQISSNIKVLNIFRNPEIFLEYNKIKTKEFTSHRPWFKLEYKDINIYIVYLNQRTEGIIIESNINHIIPNLAESIVYNNKRLIQFSFEVKIDETKTQNKLLETLEKLYENAIPIIRKVIQEIDTLKSSS